MKYEYHTLSQISTLPKSVSDYDTVFRQMLERVFPIKIDEEQEAIKQAEKIQDNGKQNPNERN